MKISCSWLRELTGVGAAPREIADALSSLGHAVDTLTASGEDHVLDIDVTSNRPDCLSAIGLARELAACYGAALKLPETQPHEAGHRIENITSITVDAPELCPRYCARVIENVSVGPSPEWMKRRLEDLGVRSINNIVDVTNYVMLEMGHPVHAFDLDKLAGGMIRVRRAAQGEKLRTLDGVDRVLDPDVLVIADQRDAVALAGIMGGEHSEISAGTKRILLESAHFEPRHVRRTAKKLGMRTEASARFEKGCDPEAPPRAADRVCRLLQEMGCSIARGYIDVKTPTPAPVVIELTADEVQALLGVAVPSEECARILEALEFIVRSAPGDRMLVMPPSHRVDIALGVDLIEEIARFRGYEKIPGALPPLQSEPENLPAHLAVEEEVRDYLAGAGFTEIISYSFIGPDRDGAAQVPLMNPISERTHLRHALLPGMIEAAQHNINHGQESLRLFELGHVFSAERRESAAIGILLSGPRAEKGWRSDPRSGDFYDLKGTVEEIVECISGCAAVFQRSTDRSRIADVLVGGVAAGAASELRVDERHAGFYVELDLSAFVTPERDRPRYAPIVRLPASWRDVSFVVDEAAELASIEAAVGAAGGDALVRISLIDLYRGGNLPAGKKSMTIRLKFQLADRTMESAEVDELCARCVGAIERLGGVRR